MDGYWYYFGGSNDGSLKTDIGLYDYGVYVGIDGRWDETRYQYTTGEFLSELQIINNGKDYNNACLMFWHNYGMSSSDEDFFSIGKRERVSISFRESVPKNNLYFDLHLHKQE